MFYGNIVSLITPFKNNKIEIEHVCKLVEFHICSGTHAIVVAGTTGESGTLSYKEKLLIIKTAVNQSNNRIPIIAGVSEISTENCIQYSKEAEFLGSNALLVMTPHYIKPTQYGLYKHYKYIAHSIKIPIILYNVPHRTGCNLHINTIKKLSSINNIIGIKESIKNISRLKNILKVCENKIKVFSGNDKIANDWMLSGASGVISVSSNIVAKKISSMYNANVNYNFNESKKINENLNLLYKLLCIEINPIPIKWILYKIGFINNELRLPMTILSSISVKKMENTMDYLYSII